MRTWANRGRLLVAAGLGVLACGAPLREATEYSGSREPVLVDPAGVRELGALPAGYESMGEVSAECRVSEPRSSLRGAWLSDVDCTEQRLVGALRERAAEVGGELLVARRCSSRVHRRAAGTLDVRCRAELARPEPDLLLRRAPGGASGALAAYGAGEVEAPASEAWRIQVDFTPSAVAAGRPARRTELVRELVALPPSHVTLGDVVARCERGCSERALQEGIRTVAGRMGATDVVSVRCVSRDRGWLCSGTAAGYEVDPDTDPRAR